MNIGVTGAIQSKVRFSSMGLNKGRLLHVLKREVWR